MSELSSLQNAVNSGNTSTEQYKDHILKLKIDAAELCQDPDKQNLALAREILETITLFTAQANDLAAFEKSFIQLRAFYSDFNSGLPESENKWRIIGLFLIYLVTENRISEFHSELETIPLSFHSSNPYIKLAVDIEQSISEGSYRKFLGEARLAPDPIYRVFMSDFLSAVREKVASCCEKAYESLTLASAQKLLFFENSQQVEEYATKKGWNLENGVIDFTEATNTDQALPAKELIAQSLNYAKELETII
eukprot:c21040_g2_i1.p1 GENE.c21040_g2_i1~~c21040_g2_i1.p1  ORF type:complete len:251 (+),score=76.61 c21040_g2_i1:585-1337(+)